MNNNKTAEITDIDFGNLSIVEINFIEMERQIQRISDLTEQAKASYKAAKSALIVLAPIVGVPIPEGFDEIGERLEKLGVYGTEDRTTTIGKMQLEINTFKAHNEEIKERIEDLTSIVESGMSANGGWDYENLMYNGEKVSYNEILEATHFKDFSSIYPEGASTLYDGSYTEEEFCKMLSNFGETLGSNVIDYCVMSVKDGFYQNILPNASEFYKIAMKNGLDPTFIVSIACVESGFGSSSLAANKGNLFGMGAFSSYHGSDNIPDVAFKYDNVVSGIEDVCNNLSDNYITPGGKFFTGPNISDIGRTYATESWAPQITAMMNQLKRYM